MSDHVRPWPPVPAPTIGRGRGKVLDLLADFGLTPEEAEQWCRAWEARAYAENQHRHAADYWRGATIWILGQLHVDIIASHEVWDAAQLEAGHYMSAASDRRVPGLARRSR